MDNYQIGGRLLATGSKSCIFTPNIPCKGDKKKSKKTKISKIIYGPKSKQLIEQEKKINNRIKRIKNYKQWSLIYDEYCKPDEYDKLLHFDKDIKKCFKNTIHGNDIQEFNKNSVMLIGDYGGITYETYFEKHFNDIKNFTVLRTKFLKLMKMMKPLFVGLETLQKHNIVHKDIKYNNIVIHKNVFKYIDFGLSSNLSDTNHFKTRSLNEFNTQRIYLWYPLEYIFYEAGNIDLNKELTNVYSNNTRKGHELFVELHNMFDRDINEIYYNVITKIQNKSYKHIDIFKKIDVYSLGIMVPLLFLTKTKIPYPFNHDECVFDFYKLFREMSEPNLEKRINGKEACKQYNSLIKKYS